MRLLLLPTIVSSTPAVFKGQLRMTVAPGSSFLPAPQRLSAPECDVSLSQRLWATADSSLFLGPSRRRPCRSRPARPSSGRAQSAPTASREERPRPRTQAPPPSAFLSARAHRVLAARRSEEADNIT